MTNLTILNTTIRTLDNLYSLNDLHKIGGNEPRHQPSLFLANKQTQELIEELHKESSLEIPRLVNSINGGRYRGTYACEELALAYATWISPKFHLVVLRAFLAMHKGEGQKNAENRPLAIPELTFTVEMSEDNRNVLLSNWFALHNTLNYWQR
ncbi:hypothetical protein A4G19_10990 [Pasteurellaceae bacterium Macca]|nr:hypothetical protein [Pasteurellaceae bacterium Macca]